MNTHISTELQYVLLVVGLFIVPRALQRFRLPGAVTCLVIGAAVGIGLDAFHGDSTVGLLATLGIVTMFLFAGLEVDFAELKQGRRILIQHVVAQLVLLVVGAAVLGYVLDLEARASVLLALALTTPSTGFILDSLASLGLGREERFWVKSKAIASELVALGVLFLVIQSTDLVTLAVSALVLAAMVALLPPLFRAFSHLVAPFAPRSEFTFLVIVALLCAFVTRELGVYYLVGAFVVGLTAVRMRKNLPGLSSERLLGAVELFASFFIPFYFFKAGLHLRAEHFSLTAVGLAVALLLVVVPVRIARVAIHRRWALGEDWRTGVRIGTAVVPTLVFTIVIADILESRFALSPDLFGALIVFTIVNTLLPGYLLRVPAPEYETPEVPRPEAEVAPAASQTSAATQPAT